MKVEDELRIRLERAGDSVPLRPIAAADLVRRGRASRRRRVAFAAAGVAAVLAATAVLVTQTVGVGDESGLPPVKEPERSESYSPSPAEREASALVQMWVRILADGDYKRGWELLSDRGQEAWAGRGAFTYRENGWKHIYGVWADAENAEYRARTIRMFGREVIVVTVAGELQSGPSSASFVVSTERGRAGLSPFEGPGSVQFETPTFAAEGTDQQTAMPVVGSLPEFEVRTYPKVKEALMLIEGPASFRMEPATVDHSQFASTITYVPSESLDPGIHTATVVVGGPLDTVDTWAVRFVVR